MTNKDPLLNTLFAERFHIEKVLGIGGMGAVYLARHDVLQRQFALKVIRRDLVGDSTILQRFKREARAASRIQHPHVVEIVDFGNSAQGTYLAMEYVEGPTLEQTLKNEGPFAPERVLAILGAVASGLYAAHAQGVVHRDLKPRNIILALKPRQDFVKVLDFGLAKIIGDAAERLTEVGFLFGTPEYLAPETCLDREVDQRVDIYSLGVLGFELLAGHPPFRGTPMDVLRKHVDEEPPSLIDIRADLPAPIAILVERCLEKDPNDRFQSGEEVVQAVESLLGQRRTQRFSTLGPITEPLFAQSDTHQSLPTVEIKDTIPPAQSRELALEELAHALRDRGFGSPIISYALAMRAEAKERRLEAEHAIDVIEARHLTHQENSQRRQVLLGKMLSTLGQEMINVENNEKTIADEVPKKDTEERWEMRSLLDACIRNLEDRLRGISAQSKRFSLSLNQELGRWQRLLEQAKETEEQRTDELEDHLREAVADTYVLDEELAELVENACMLEPPPIG